VAVDVPRDAPPRRAPWIGTQAIVPARITSVSASASWYDRTNKAFTVDVSADKGGSCAAEVVFENALNGKTYSFSFAGPNPMPGFFSRPFGEEPHAGDYRVTVRGAKGNSAQVPACAGSAVTTAHLGEKELGHPLPTLTGAVWLGPWSKPSDTFLVTKETDKELGVTVANGSFGKAPNQECAVTVDVWHKRLNLRHQAAVLVRDQGKVNVPSLIRGFWGSVPTGDFDIVLRSTEHDQSLGPPCMGTVKQVLHAVDTGVIRPAATMKTQANFTAHSGGMGGTYIGSYTIMLDPKIEGPNCTYTLWVGPKDTSNAYEHGQTLRLWHLAANPVVAFEVGSVGNHFRLHIHAKPEDAQRGTPCAGEYIVDDIVFPGATSTNGK
jgi:hypothetical protein